MITLSEDAAEVVRSILADGDLPQGCALRLGVTSEGCEGSGTKFRYILDPDPDPAKPDDQLFESHGVRIVVSRESLPHLDGLQLGVRPKLGGVDFVFQNPQATHSCGCGHTFSD
jgi:iron-sulfur cluster assembly protein